MPTDEELGRIAYEAGRTMNPTMVRPWCEISEWVRAFYVTAARAVRAAVLPAGAVVLDRATVEGAAVFLGYLSRLARVIQPDADIDGVDVIRSRLTAAVGEGR